MPDDLAWRTCCIEYVLRRVYMCWCVCARSGCLGRERGGEEECFVSIWCDAGTKVVCLLVDFFFSPKARFYFTYLRAIVGYFGTSVKLFEISQIPVYKADYKEGFFFPFHRELLRIPFLCMYAEMPTDLIIIRYPL